jgi:hypothetical protein
MYQLSHRMGVPVGVLEDVMSADELIHHMVLWDVDPWTNERKDWQTALLCMVIANCMTGAKHSVEDFLPNFQAAEQHAEETDPEMMLLQSMKWVNMMGGTITKMGNAE